MEQSLSTPEPCENSKLPRGWKVESLADGSWRVMRLGSEQRSMMDYVALAIFWIAGAAFLGTIAFRLVSVQQVFEFYRSNKILLPFTLFGLLLVMSAFNGGQEWIVSHNRLELRWGGKSPNFRKSHLYTDGKFGLRRYSDDGSAYWQLDFECRTGFMNQGCIDKSYEPTAFDDLHYLGSILSAKTGWPLKIPSEMNGKDRL